MLSSALGSPSRRSTRGKCRAGQRRSVHPTGRARSWRAVAAVRPTPRRTRRTRGPRARATASFNSRSGSRARHAAWRVRPGSSRSRRRPLRWGMPSLLWVAVRPPAVQCQESELRRLRFAKNTPTVENVAETLKKRLEHLPACMQPACQHSTPVRPANQRHQAPQQEVLKREKRTGARFVRHVCVCGTMLGLSAILMNR